MSRSLIAFILMACTFGCKSELLESHAKLSAKGFRVNIAILTTDGSCGDTDQALIGWITEDGRFHFNDQ